MMNVFFSCSELFGCRSGPGRFAPQSAKNMYMMNMDIVVIYIYICVYMCIHNIYIYICGDWMNIYFR